MIAISANQILNDLVSLPMMVTMVKVGESKYDNYGRITCSIKIAELLELEKGEDLVEWHVIGGEVVLRKKTKTYYGFDLESKDIRERLISFEEEHIDEGSDLELDPEERLRKAEQEYEKEKKARAQRIANQKSL